MENSREVKEGPSSIEIENGHFLSKVKVGQEKLQLDLLSTLTLSPNLISIWINIHEENCKSDIRMYKCLIRKIDNMMGIIQ